MRGTLLIIKSMRGQKTEFRNSINIESITYETVCLIGPHVDSGKSMVTKGDPGTQCQGRGVNRGLCATSDNGDFRANLGIGAQSALQDDASSVNTVFIAFSLVNSNDPTFRCYFPLEMGQPPVVIGSYTISILSKTEGFQYTDGNAFPNMVTTRELKFVDSKKKERNITHHQIHAWPKDRVPEFDHDLIYQLWQPLSLSTKPIVIHSMMGQDRAMAFAGIHFGAQFVEDRLIGHHISNVFDWLRKHRIRSIGSICLMMYIKAGIMYKLWMDYASDGEEKTKCMKEYRSYMEQLRREFFTTLPQEEVERRQNIRDHARIVYGNGL